MITSLHYGTPQGPLKCGPESDLLSLHKRRGLLTFDLCNQMPFYRVTSLALPLRSTPRAGLNPGATIS